MDLNILIAALGILVAALAEARAARRDSRKDRIQSLGISLLQLLQVLDNIVKAGDQLISELKQLCPEDKSSHKISRPEKKHILSLIAEQQRNLETFVKLYSTPLDHIKTDILVSVGSAVELMVGDETKEILGIKSYRLEALTWKVLDGETSFARLGMAIQLALKSLESGFKIERRWGALSSHTPVKLTVKELVQLFDGEQKAFLYIPSNFREESTEIASYDFTKRADCIEFVVNANQELAEIKTLRQQLAELTRESFSMDDLVGL